MRKLVRVSELTTDSFGAYGQIISRDDYNPIMTEREFTFWNNLAQLSCTQEKIDFGILEVVKREKTFSKIERHLLTEEAFFALDGDCLLLAGQPTDGEDYVDAETVQAFRLKQGKGVVFGKGTWHWLPFPIAEKALLMVVCRQGTVDNDLEIVDMQEQGISFEIDF